MATRHIHRIPVADEFIEPIGEAVCVCQYLDDGLHCIGRRLSETFYGYTEGKSSGRLTANLMNVVESAKIDDSLRFELSALCEDAKAIFLRRNEVVHSRGYTNAEGEQSRLYRNDPKQEYVYLDPGQIREFIGEAAAIACRANALLHDNRMPAA